MHGAIAGDPGIQAAIRDIRHMHEQALDRQDDLYGIVYELTASQSLANLQGEAASQRIAYNQTLQRIRDEVRASVPRDAVLAVISRGDDNLRRLYGRKAWHFPQNAQGAYAGFYPANGVAAIAHLEALKARGATHLLIPETSLWWLETYPDFRSHLDRRYDRVNRIEGLLTIYALQPPEFDADAPLRHIEEIIAAFRHYVRREPAILDWDSGLELARAFPQLTVFSPPEKDGVLPYLDESIDLVAAPAGLPAMLAEADRVAHGAVIAVGGGKTLTECPIEVKWRPRGIAAKRLKTSIIIPVFNGLSLTQNCLRTLGETLPRGFDVEVFVVDDASTDGTAEWLANAAGPLPLQVIRNETNAGFIANCNRAAEAAGGDILLFLNNDTLLLPGWFLPILQTFREYPDAGAVGGRLLFPDGRIQEAGGIVFRDGSAAHFGRDDYQLNEEVYNVVREVDYCSAAMLATPRRLFREIGGFDPRYGFGYFEDTDYCFQVRTKGLKVYCQPQSTIVHLEGATAGTDLRTGAKHYQIANQPKFVDRWRAELAIQPERPDLSNRAAWDALAYFRQGGKPLRR
jgi:GT2 family glycosyltransferase